MASSWQSGLSAHVSTVLISLWIMTHFYQLQQASSQGLLLLFLGWYAHFWPMHVHLWDISERYNGWTFPWCLHLHIIVWTDERGTWKLHPRMNQTCAILFLISWLISFDFTMMLHKEAVCFKCALKSTGVSLINSNVVNKPIRGFQRHDIIIWAFPNCLKA